MSHTTPFGALRAVTEYGLNLSDVTEGDATTARHGFVKKLPGGTTTFLRGDGAFATPAGSGGSGVVIRVVNTQTGAYSTGTTTIPLDDTIPQNTEGTEFLTCSITPTDAANKLRIDVALCVGPSNTNWITAALFQDTTANALAATTEFQTSGTGTVSLAFTHYMTAGTTSATTFKVRAGGNSASTTSLNGAAGGRILGGVATSSITISEIVP
jgi:hypothetical protein